ncbi:MAG: restriction endonuclease subunit S [Sulfurimonas sp.]|uniref:restriction endonuclease subunit S n=1 Tax=Sulfurimonas sp. TaxID=2022749 RepID=UPI0025F3E789|nr:restriction endonuclease subunit S [Sulfurimonas sp.]MCK9490720.1 restriction endonuclease subunit S [Sulfurimonas sp.]
MFSDAFINQFNEFQKKTNQYQDLNIEDIVFEEKKLSDISSITMGQSPDGPSLNTEGNGLPFYQGKTEFTNVYIGEPTKWTTNSKKTADKDDILISMRAPAGAVNISTEHISIGRGLAAIKVNPNIDMTYLFMYLKSIEARINLEKDSGGFYSSMTKDELYDFDIFIPQDIDDEYNSFNVQQVFVDFLKYQKKQTEILRKKMISMQEKIYKTDKAILSKIFEMKDPFIIQQFNKWAQLKSYEIDGNDIQFDIKRVIADNPEDSICKKRMGFTPKRDPEGDINWFTVADMNAVDGMYINEPNTKEKTTMDLIKQTVDKQNTGKSEKLIPIKKGDILVSFKLTVGVVKIYNSDKPAYCNEAIDIISVHDNIFNQYVAYNCMLEYPKHGTQTNNGMTLNDESKKEIQIMTPQSTKQYTSLEMQKIIIEFFAAFNLWKNQILDLTSSINTKCDVVDNAFLNEIFKGHTND